MRGSDNPKLWKQKSWGGERRPSVNGGKEQARCGSIKQGQLHAEWANTPKSRRVVMFILGLAFFQVTPPAYSSSSFQSFLGSWPEFLPHTLSVPQANLLSNQARNQKVWALPATQSYSGAHCQGINGIVLD